ncbi:MAG: VanW family protein [Eggerthellaceae bacterium]|nr:VanW family protein [Eggerthellaceae bacterium]
MSAARSRRANDKHNHLQRTPILVMGCSLLIACCIAFGGTNWTASAQPSEDQLPEENAIVEPGYYQETIGSYEAISQSDDDERAENLRLAAEAINGYVIEPGATFSFNEVVGDTTAERGYKEAPVLYSSGLGSSDGGGICQVSTALYIAAVKADLEIVERHPHSVPSDYAPIGLDATIVYGSRDLRIKNNTDFPITIYAKAVGQTVSVNLLGKPRDDGITIDATSRVVDRYEQATKDGGKSAADLRQAEDNTSDAPAAAPASTPATQPAPAAQPAAPAANADGLSNEDALLVDFLIGKTLNDDVANADDTFALPKGTEITREIALDAKKHDALLLLTMSVD